MATTRVQVLNEVSTEPKGCHGHQLCFQWCRYVYGDNTLDYGYRFIWKTPDNKLLAHRGQARIHSIALMMKLVQMAIDAGWGDYDGSDIATAEKRNAPALFEALRSMGKRYQNTEQLA